MDINRALRSAISTGKVFIGTDETKKALTTGKARLIIVSKNAPRETYDAFEAHPKVAVYQYNGTNEDLGSACGKPYPISVLSVYTQGNSNIFALRTEMKKSKEEPSQED